MDGNRRADAGLSPGDPVGRCRSCRFARATHGRGERAFWRCGRSDADPAFPRYPRLPVVRCAGWEPAAAAPDPPD